MFPELLGWVFAAADWLWWLLVGGGAYGLLFYCLLVSQDYRKRKRFHDATRHLTQAQLEAGLAINMQKVATYLRDKPKGWLPSRKAEAALVMATVLREHLATKAHAGRGPRYLKARRAVLREAKHYLLAQSGGPEDHLTD